MIRELQPKCGVFVCTVNFWNCVDPKPYFDEPGDHGGELETSLMMHLAPNLVLPLKEAGDGKAKKFRVAGLREGWAWAPREWTKVTEDTGVGNPAAATAEKGKKFFEAVTDRVSGFLVDLASADVAKMYEVPYVIDGVLVEVDDVDEHFERARAAGATILSEPEDVPDFGVRHYRAEDPEGHRWMFSQDIAT